MARNRQRLIDAAAFGGMTPTIARLLRPSAPSRPLAPAPPRAPRSRRSPPPPLRPWLEQLAEAAAIAWPVKAAGDRCSDADAIAAIGPRLIAVLDRTVGQLAPHETVSRWWVTQLRRLVAGEDLGELADRVTAADAWRACVVRRIAIAREDEAAR